MNADYGHYDLKNVYSKIDEPLYYNYSTEPKIQRTVIGNLNITSNDIMEENDKYIYTDRTYGGSYNLDYYNYLKYGKKRYENLDTISIELQSIFKYEDLDLLKKTKPTDILIETDRDDIYKIYQKIFIPYIEKHKNKQNSLAELFIWIADHECYLMDIFINKFKRLYKNDNPFIKDGYLLDPNVYLYNRKLISTYSKYIKLEYNYKANNLVLPRNEYRIER
jgi:hypothetical protein